MRVIIIKLSERIRSLSIWITGHNSERRGLVESVSSQWVKGGTKESLTCSLAKILLIWVIITHKRVFKSLSRILDISNRISWGRTVSKLSFLSDLSYFCLDIISVSTFLLRNFPFESISNSLLSRRENLHLHLCKQIILAIPLRSPSEFVPFYAVKGTKLEKAECQKCKVRIDRDI